MGEKLLLIGEKPRKGATESARPRSPPGSSFLYDSVSLHGGLTAELERQQKADAFL